MTKLSGQDIEKIIDLYEKNIPVLEIAREVNCNQWSVYYQIKIKRSRRFYFPEKIVIKPRKFKTEIRNCDCLIQDCKGKFLANLDKGFTVCPHEALRRNLIKNLIEYYQ